MGVVYKLKPEIKDFILEQKRATPLLSCRALVALVDNKFQIKVSKSSINSIIKEAGISMPVGRRPKKRRRRQEISKPVALLEMKTEEMLAPVIEQPAEPVLKEPAKMPVETQVDITLETPSEMECTGAILLKAADYLIKGSYYITKAINDRLNKQEKELLAKTESLIYLPLFKLTKETPDKGLPRLWGLIGKKLSLEDILSYLNELQSVRPITSDIWRIISNILQEVRCIKINYANGDFLYLDGQMHTIWSAPHIPYDFSLPLYNIKDYINKYFYEDSSFVLFMAPGYDTPTKEFFNFILSLASKEREINRLTLYDNKLEELEVMSGEPAKRPFFVFGLWPWQFVEYRQAKKIGEFKPHHFAALKKDFSLAEIEIELSQPNIKQSVTIRGCALKTSPAEKIRLIILSNIPPGVLPAGELANIYLSHWPNLEEAFQDFSRKIELFTYDLKSQRYFLMEIQSPSKETQAEIKALFNYYLKALDSYVRRYFLPRGLEDKDFSTLKEQFYNLKAILKREKDYTRVVFQPPLGFPFQKELEYACRRLNEREIVSSEGERLWFLT